MIVGINGLRNTEVKAALAHHFQVSKQTFILCHIKADDFPGSVVNSAVERKFLGGAKLFKGSGIDLDQLPGMRLLFAAVSTFFDFFLRGL